MYFVVDDDGPNAEHGTHWHTRTNFSTWCRWSGTDTNTARLRLPPSVHDDALFFADDLVVPVPSLHVDGLALKRRFDP